MLSTAALASIIRCVTYKPGWKLIVHEPDDGVQGPYLTMAVETANSTDPDESIELHIHSPIPPQVDDEAFLRWLAWRIEIAERHEMLEWFQVDGEPWIDPHASIDLPD